MRRVMIIIAVLATAGLAGAPAAWAGPEPKIDWSDLVDQIVDPDLEVGEDMC